jgi:hypothetical protein
MNQAVIDIKLSSTAHVDILMHRGDSAHVALAATCYHRARHTVPDSSVPAADPVSISRTRADANGTIAKKVLACIKARVHADDM